MTDLDWLPIQPGVHNAIRALRNSQTPWADAQTIARTPLDPLATNVLDTMLGLSPPPTTPTQAHLLVVGSATTAHLRAGIRIGALRRGLTAHVSDAALGIWSTDLAHNDEPPSALLFALDAHHLAAGVTTTMDHAQARREGDSVLARVRGLWREAKRRYACPIAHQLPLPLHPALLGGAEHRLAGSKAAFITRLTQALRDAADLDGVDLVALDHAVLRNGLAAWHEPALWHHAKQEIAPTAAPLYGDLVARWLAALAGKSFKCLVLDLDNTLWGGVIGDDGLAGIEIGPGSAVGEAHLALQAYAKALSQRGVILAVCSKTTKQSRSNPSPITPTCCCGGMISPVSSPTGVTRPPICAPSPTR